MKTIKKHKGVMERREEQPRTKENNKAVVKHVKN